MSIESILGFHAAKQEAIRKSQSSTYAGKYIHIEWIEDNYYQLNIHDTYLGDGNSDIVDCYRNGVQVLSHDDMIDALDSDDSITGYLVDEIDPDDIDESNTDNPVWSDDDAI